MKKNLMALICFFFVFSFLSCEKEENLYNVPAFQESVLDEKANVITATSAEIRMKEENLSDTAKNGQVKKYDYYLCYSLSPDMSEPSEEISLATRYVKGVFGYEYKVHYFGLTNLTPNTTYYYKVYVKGCGDSQFGSSVKSFTTSSSLKISKVTITDWDGKIKEVKDSVGIALANYEKYGNFAYQKDGRWVFNNIVSEDDIKNIAFYYPYEKGQTVNHAQLYCRTHIFGHSQDEKYTYYGEVSKLNDGTLVIHLKPASVRVRFHFYLEDECGLAFGASSVRFYQLTLESSGDYSFVSYLDLVKGKNSYTDDSKNTKDYQLLNFYMNEASKPVVVSSRMLPTTGVAEIKLSIVTNHTKNPYSWFMLDSNSWIAGNTYDYDIVFCDDYYTAPYIVVTDVTGKYPVITDDVSVNPWGNNQGEDINIYNLK